MACTRADAEAGMAAVAATCKTEVAGLAEEVCTAMEVHKMEVAGPVKEVCTAMEVHRTEVAGPERGAVTARCTRVDAGPERAVHPHGAGDAWPRNGDLNAGEWPRSAVVTASLVGSKVATLASRSVPRAPAGEAGKA